MGEDEVSCILAITGVAVAAILLVMSLSWGPTARAARKRRQAHWVPREGPSQNPSSGSE